MRIQFGLRLVDLHHGQKVYESTDGGVTWTNISTGLPNLPIMSIVHYKKATDRNVYLLELILVFM